MKIRCVAFDFDGTLVDSADIFLSVFTKLATQHKLKQIDPSQLEAFKKLSMLERLQALEIPLWKLPTLTRKFLSEYKAQIANIRYFPDIKEVLQKLKDTGLLLAIVSSNEIATIRQFLSNNNGPDISEIYCSSRIFGKEKALQKLMDYQHLQSSEILYVCDELRDIRACRKLNIQTIWVSWGFEMREALGDETPDHIADSPEDLFDTIIDALNR